MAAAMASIAGRDITETPNAELQPCMPEFRRVR